THSPAHKQVRHRISTPPDALEDDAGVKDRECGIRTYSGTERWSQMALERVDTYLETHRSRFEEQLKDLIRIPSISAQPDHDPDTQRAAAFVRDDLSAMGLKAELIPTRRHPLVYAEWLGAPGKPTLLVYGHYDVQPPEPLEPWLSPPFEPTIRN